MAALDALLDLDGDWKQEYDLAIAAASDAVVQLPLVRVVLSSSRYQAEFDDVFKHGTVSVEHRGGFTKVREQRLGIGGQVYLHGGRTHPDYGSAFFAFRSLDLEVEATPFGVGNLFCEEDHDAPVHDCVFPVAHAPDDAQRTFVNESSWREEWRDYAAQYLALYFAPDFSRYFEDLPGKPTRVDPDGIFAAPQTVDWRAWTIELRAPTTIDLRAALERGQIVRWGVADELEENMNEEATKCGLARRELYPFFDTLAREAGHLRLLCPGKDAIALFKRADALVRDEVVQ